jgi:DNA-binding winged helix-turn-helix (wHTH) protein
MLRRAAMKPITDRDAGVPEHLTPSRDRSDDDTATLVAIAHDAPAVLGRMAMAADALLGSSAASAIEPAQVIVDGCRRLAVMVRRLASLIAVPGPRSVHLNALIANIVSTLCPMLAGTVQVSTRLEEPLRPVWVDPGGLERGLLMLLLDAGEKTSAMGPLVLSTSAVRRAAILAEAPSDGHWVLLEIEGHHGDAAAFARMEQAARRVGGDVGIESTPDRGSVARVWLPVATRDVVEHVAVDVAGRGEPGGAPSSDGPPATLHTLVFPPFRLDVTNETLWRGRKELPLRAKPFRILRYLAEHPQRLVTQQELTEAIWGKLVTSESLLRTHVHELRQVLDDDIIETVTGRGYRFVPEVIRDAERIPGPRPRRPRKPG